MPVLIDLSGLEAELNDTVRTALRPRSTSILAPRQPPGPRADGRRIVRTSHFIACREGRPGAHRRRRAAVPAGPMRSRGCPALHVRRCLVHGRRRDPRRSGFPANRIGRLLLTAGALMAVGVFSGGYSQASVAPADHWPMTPAFAWRAVPTWCCRALDRDRPARRPDGVPGRTPAVAAMAVARLASRSGPPWRGSIAAGPHARDAQRGHADRKPLRHRPLALPLADRRPACRRADGDCRRFSERAPRSATRYRRGSSVERQQIRWLMAMPAGRSNRDPGRRCLLPATILAERGLVCRDLIALHRPADSPSGSPSSGTGCTRSTGSSAGRSGGRS